MINNITSKDNSKIRDLIKIRDDKKYRDEKSLYFIEGERVVSDTKKELIENLYIDSSCIDKFTEIIKNIPQDKIYILSSDVYNKVKDTINSQGIIATVHSNIIKNIDKSFLKGLSQILILDNIQDPGNLGTILRVAEASNVSLIILSKDCCDIFNTKVSRSQMSSLSRSNIYISNDLKSDIMLLKNNMYKVYASVLSENSKFYNSIKYNNKTAIIIGNEGNGIRKDIVDISDENIIIPMSGKIESLNASIATAIICYEVFNQLNNNENK